ncbi:methyltransferase [Reichenbachiella sp. 5M10]|uniref:class I SAM-dependent methyltransferase n=1 Tax=Reichenbachiella sp. 5M10 TaxID=1889772 RepID=UPI000C15C88C|nr:class I SAM-dependent methyltransferase [Reichenbachiella sp. 5M10]PIB34039.1 methyltransferase [Reichenbachiella sp. 5M10]
MAEFWEEAFKDKQEMWGEEPAKSTVWVNDYFVTNRVSNVLVPGFGYGRNARVFTASGMRVTGIEISSTAIDLARPYFGPELMVHHGSVTDMPFDNLLYDGIYCYALIHLLGNEERRKLIHDCYHQLSESGRMVFATISKQASIYGQGNVIGKDRFEMFGGVKMFFYDQETIEEEFGSYGLVEVREVSENYPFHLIVCEK